MCVRELDVIISDLSNTSTFCARCIYLLGIYDNQFITTTTLDNNGQQNARIVAARINQRFLFTLSE